MPAAHDRHRNGWVVPGDRHVQRSIELDRREQRGGRLLRRPILRLCAKQMALLLLLSRAPLPSTRACGSAGANLLSS